MSELKLPVWSAGVVVTILSPLVSSISIGELDWNYLGWFNFVLWGFIALAYIIYIFFKDKQEYTKE